MFEILFKKKKPKASKTIVIEGLNEVVLKKHKQARYIKIRVAEQGCVSVVMPHYVSYNAAIDFLKQKIDWVKEELNKFSQLAPPITEFKTKFRELELIPCDMAKASYRLSPTRIKVYYPGTAFGVLTVAPLPQDDSIQRIIREAIEKALRKEAKVYLPRRLDELAQKHNLQYQKLRIKNTKTRWGSCSHSNNINLCSHLMKLPDKLIDYVILHELAHTVEKNHSEKFWTLLSNLLGEDAKTLDKELKRYRTSL